VARKLLRWARRLAVLAVVIVVIDRVRASRSSGGGVPTIGGDTWPPVPVNANRHD
jgi:hypothetical protein